MNVQSPKEKGRELEISSQFDAIFSTATRAFVCKVRLSIDKHGSFLIGPDWRATISESYITYLHFDDKVSTALARSIHKKQQQ